VKKPPSSGNENALNRMICFGSSWSFCSFTGMIRITILKNIALVTYGLITLFQGLGREWVAFESGPGSMFASGNWAEGKGTTVVSVLDNVRLTPELLIPLHIALACGTKLRERLPMILDQTSIRGIETLLIGVGL